MFVLQNLVILFFTFVFFVIYYYNKRLNYFKNQNVPYLKSFPLLGTLTDVIIGKKGIYDWALDIYNNPKFVNEKFYGIFMFHKPSLVIRDPEIIKQILVKDFNNFTNRCARAGDHDSLGQSNLFFAKDSLWRDFRKKLTPFFTSGRMKVMFPILEKISDNLIEHFEASATNKSFLDIQIKEKIMLFTTDTISSVAFGVDANALQNKNSEFARICRKMFDFTLVRGLEFTSIFLLPEITKLFKFQVFTSEGSEFFTKSITHVMKVREESKTQRHDLIDTLIEIKNAQVQKNEEYPMEYLVAQAAVFFAAGLETSAAAATFLLYELAKHPESQTRVRQEIKAALERTNGKLTYEIVMQETPYLHQVLMETLRLFPPIPHLDRECTNLNGYSLEPYSDFVIPYKMPIFIPIYGIQRDENYFPDPQKFDPERFSPENIQNIETYMNMPFGVGNRSCIGERYGLMQSKTAVTKILMHYRLEMTEKTPKEIKLAKNAMMIQPEVPIVLRFVKDEIANN